MKMSKKIQEIKPGDNGVEFDAIITHVVNGKTNKAPYLSLTFQDATGLLDAKLWAATPEQIATVTAGKVVHVVGDAIKYNDDLQLKVNKLQILDSSEEEQVKYLKAAPMEREDLLTGIKAYIAKIENKKLNTIVSALFSEHQALYVIFPAASRNHHEYVSGLAYHTLSMLQIAETLCQQYETLNRDLLFSGVIMHDLGKVFELSGPIVPEYTMEGKLLGHISIAQALVERCAKEKQIEGEEVVLLKHMILSHHGKMEYGSPVLPLVKEAEILYLIDNIDARMNMMDKALDGVEPGGFTKRVFSLENRSFYKPKLYEKDPEQ